MVEENSNYNFMDNRVFIDIASGCGNNCSYCYISNKNQKQIVFNQEQLDLLVENILKNENFLSGSKGTLLSFSPHTEPFMNNLSIEAIIYLLKKFLPLGNRVQIATKEVLTEEIINFIKQNAVDVNQVSVFISISKVLDYRNTEPFAASINARLKNIEICKKNGIKNCLYIKPFLVSKSEEMKKLLECIEFFDPDAICIGVFYNVNVEKRGKAHPTEKQLYSYGISTDMIRFMDLYNYNKPIFLTSSCVVSYFNDCYNNVDIPSELCIGCNINCKKKGKWN